MRVTVMNTPIDIIRFCLVSQMDEIVVNTVYA